MNRSPIRQEPKQQGNSSNASGDIRARIDPQIIDFAHLKRYTMGDAALEAELLGLFRIQAGQQFGQICQAETIEDWKMAVHTLKGAARGVGAGAIAALAETIENAGFDSPKNTKDALLAELDQQISVCAAQIELLT